MNWIDSVKEIKKAQEKNQLVIFVGAGVSKNSGVPTWWELIKTIANEIGYDKCEYCRKRKDSCPEAGCEDRYAFTQDEFLRIPEYFYQKDTSENHREYYGLIKATLNCNNNSNPIDEEIFNILPHHIITTNYDSLLENAPVLNSQLYTVVSQDKDLLSKADERYIIKMHGDLDIPETIVLRESDYINYEQQHTLISTFIRSLLVNHTFVFLGYSLNDYNLNLIIGWINYFRKFYEVEKRPFNFLVSTETSSEFEKIRLEDKNIYIVDLTSLPDNLVEMASKSESLKNIAGKRLFSYLRCITDSELLRAYIPLSEILAEKYQVLKSYRKISFTDLICIYPLGDTTFIGTELVFYDEKWYEQIAAILDNGVPEVVDTFQRAGLTAIHCFNDDSIRRIPVSEESEDKGFSLYLANDYKGLWEYIQSQKDTAAKIYYYHLLGQSAEEIEEAIEAEASAIDSKEYILILLHKMRARAVRINILDRQETKTKELERLFRTAPVRYRDAIQYLRMLFESSAKNLLEMDKRLQKQEERYRFRSNAWHSGHGFMHIWEIQAYAYDYYFFFKDNYLPLDYFSEPTEYFKAYIKAILCSYSPIADNGDYEGFFGLTDRRHYPLNEIDLDIMVKYNTPKSFQAYLEKYSVQSLEIDEDVQLVQKYRNLCVSFCEFRHMKWIDQLFDFNIILCLLKLDNAGKKEITDIFFGMIMEIVQKYPRAVSDLLELLEYFLNYMIVEGADEIKGELLDVMLQENVRLEGEKGDWRQYARVVELLSPYVQEETKIRMTAAVEAIEDKETKIRQIMLFRHVLPMERYTDFLNENIDLINIESLFRLLVEKRITYNDAAFRQFVETIEREDTVRKKRPGLCTSPDWLKASINYCIVLKLLGYHVDLTKLEPYVHYSEHLRFMLNPNTFDYTRVDTSNYMWQNLIYSSHYKNYFLMHKEEMISEELRLLFDMGVETKEQQKIMYGLLLDEDELREF